MSNDAHAASRAAMVTAFAMIAHQVGGKAARDALFLSSFEVSSLPYMIMASAVVSIVVALASSRLMSAMTPANVMPVAFTASAVLQVGEWALLLQSPRAASVAVYLHMGSLGAVLISGFWSAVNERFDPRSAKKQISRIAGAATFGGLVGGLLAERVAATFTIGAMLPVLALLHLGCALAVRRIGSGPHRLQAGQVSGWTVLRDVPYLRRLGGMVLLATAAGVLIDYAFKARASATFRGEDLMRFLGVFYGVAGLATFLVQASLSRLSLEKLGLAKTVSLLPIAVGAGGAASLFAPGLVSVAATRLAEFVLRSSLFRSGYELLFTPISRQDKRATKSIIDVGSERLGDLLGGGAVRLLLLAGPAIGNEPVLWAAIALAGSALLVAARLGEGYVAALESSLMRRAIAIDTEDVRDATTRTAILRRSLRPEDTIVAAPSVAGRARDPRPPDPISALRSGEPAQVRQVLSTLEHLDRSVVPYVIPLLASPQFAPEALAALRRVAPRSVGLFSDYLLDPEQDFAVRRRIPRVLSSHPSRRSVDALLMGLQDQRFEVRYQCGRALASIRDKDPSMPMPEPAIFEAVQREVSVGRRVWDSQKLLDSMEEKEPTLVDEVLRMRANRSLEHVFTLLGLALPKEPLRMAWLGLHTTDEQIRGTALEYLESVLPGDIREQLWPYLEDNRKQGASGRTREQVLADLVNSNPSIQISLAELQKEWDARKPES
jgi:ATP/ADP translocase